MAKCFVCSMGKPELPFPSRMSPEQAAVMLGFVMGLRCGVTAEVPLICDAHMAHIAGGIAILLADHRAAILSWCETAIGELSKEVRRRSEEPS